MAVGNRCLASVVVDRNKIKYKILKGLLKYSVQEIIVFLEYCTNVLVSVLLAP